MSKVLIGFIGAGQMASALAGGIIRSGIADPDCVTAVDPAETARERFTEVTGGRTTEDPQEAICDADVLFLAVKPHLMEGVAQTIAPMINERTVVVSIAAGIRIETLQSWLGDKLKLVRVMPNTPCLVGAGACGYCTGGTTTDADAALVERLLSSVGVALHVSEPLIDTVTGVSGSGPAFVFTLIEAMADGGVRMGMPRADALRLAAQTFFGAAKMVLDLHEHPCILKDRVTSPGGTTIAGLEAMEEHAVRAAMIDAVRTATERAIELGRR